MAEVPHLAFPIRRGPNGHLAEVEQDSLDEIATCIVTILSYPLGSLPLEPTFGTAEQFTGASIPELRTALAEWEPRVGVEVEVTDRDLQRFIDYVQVTVAGNEGIA
jgi:phage baseplate assembly protein W